MITGKDKSNAYFLTSLTRITDFSEKEVEIEALDRSDWGDGDYIACEVTGSPSALYSIEISNGRMVPVLEGDFLIGAFGKRAATLEGVGDWEAIQADGNLHALTGAGLFGKATSTSLLLPRLMSLSYRGHVVFNGKKQTMQDFVVPVSQQKFTTPVVMLIGTSMSAGKTTTGRIIVHELKKMGKNVVGAKLTGAGRLRDILAYSDAGADTIIDFVDAGLPSTVVPKLKFQASLDYLLSRIESQKADVAVIEAGASPLEPYNSDLVVEAVKNNISLLVLSASDPYAVLGVESAFDITPDLITGPASNTSAAVELVEKLTGIKALNLLDRASLPQLAEILNARVLNKNKGDGGSKK